MPDPTTGYAPGEQRPLAAYAVLAGGFFASLAGALAAVRSAGRELDRPALSDMRLGTGAGRAGRAADLGEASCPGGPGQH